MAKKGICKMEDERPLLLDVGYGLITAILIASLGPLIVTNSIVNSLYLTFIGLFLSLIPSIIVNLRCKVEGRIARAILANMLGYFGLLLVIQFILAL